MFQFIVKRILALIPILLGTSILVFAIVHLTPGDPVEAMLGGQPVSADTVARMRSELGLDRPLHEQYFNFVAGALRGDLGSSLYSRQPVTKEIASRFPVTAKLTLFAMTLAVVVGIPTGVIAAARRDTPLDYGIMTGAILGVSIPSFWLGLMLILVFALHLRWFPVTGARGFNYFVLPSIALGSSAAAIIARLTRSSVLEILGMDYVRTANAKGLHHRVVMYRHALRNALIPIITMVGLQLGSLLAGSVIVEAVFALPGLGTLTVHAIFGRDYPLVQGIVLFLAVIYVFINFAVDLMYGLVNPRIRYQ